MPDDNLLPQTDKIPVVILAGGKAKPDLTALTGQTIRALVPVNEKTLLRHIVDAVLEARTCGAITVIGDIPTSGDYTTVADSGDFVENVFSGVGAYGGAPFVLIATSDLPFITGTCVEEFVRSALAIAESSSAGIIYPVVPIELCYARFPGIKRTAVRLREGAVTGGNMMLVRPAFLLAQRDRIASAYGARKSPLKLARMLGLGMIVRLVLSQKVSRRILSIAALEKRVGRLLGGTVRAVKSVYPEIATDLDRKSDFEALKNLKNR